jgi:hypothetical protein
MKKILVLVMVWVACSTATFAFNPADYNAFFKLNNKAAFTGLVGYIDADQNQVAFLQHVFKTTEEALQPAVKSENELAANNVVDYNLRNAKSILSDEQYKRYIVFMNVYLNSESNFSKLTANK